MCAKFLRFEGKLDTIYALNFADMLLEVLDGIVTVGYLCNNSVQWRG